MRSAVRDTLFILLVALVIFLAMNFTLQTSVVTGSSMEPNLHNGQRLMLSKVAYLQQEPQRGDIVVFDPPENHGSIPLIKRVIGLPGETIWIDGGKVYVDGNILVETYIEDPPHYSYEAITVPADHYFVLGDNRNQSADSHQGWTVPRDDIIAKAWISIWPFSEFGLAPNIDAADIATVTP